MDEGHIGSPCSFSVVTHVDHAELACPEVSRVARTWADQAVQLAALEFQQTPPAVTRTHNIQETAVTCLLVVLDHWEVQVELHQAPDPVRKAAVAEEEQEVARQQPKRTARRR